MISIIDFFRRLLPLNCPSAKPRLILMPYFLFDVSLSLFAWLYTDRVEGMGVQERLIGLLESLENRYGQREQHRSVGCEHFITWTISTVKYYLIFFIFVLFCEI